MTDARPNFPIDLIRLWPAGVVADLHHSPEALGALYKLARAAWDSDPYGTIPADDEAQRRLCGSTPDVWGLVRHAVARSSRTRTDGFIELPSIVAAYERALVQARQRRAAGVASAQARAPGGKRQQPTNARSTTVERSLNARSTVVQNRGSEAVAGGSGGEPRAHAGAALQRSRSKDMNQERSSAASENPNAPGSGVEQTLEDSGGGGARLAGAIYAGLEADAAAFIAEYRREQAASVLRLAFARWEKAGRITYQKDLQDKATRRVIRRKGEVRTDWAGEIPKITAYPHATPAACSIAVRRCEQEHASADRGPVENSIGFVIGVVGAFAGGKPIEVNIHEMDVVEYWEKNERQAFDAAKVKAAAFAVARKYDKAIDAAKQKRVGG